jgi:hypothetical protein
MFDGVYVKLKFIIKPVWTGAENLVPTGMRSINRSAHNQWLTDCAIPSHGVAHVLFINTDDTTEC